MDDNSATSGMDAYGSLAEFLSDECERRLRAYYAQPRDAVEHFETENDVLSGGYAYRQLFELVQNGADAILECNAASGRIHIQLGPEQLIAANTGAALDRDGIVALLNARSSAKRGGQIGRFGVGFKSLLKLGGRVDLFSRSIGLRFDPEACRRRIRAHLGLPEESRAPGMRLAEALDPAGHTSPLRSDQPYHWATTVVVASITDGSMRARLIKELADFPAEFVLFLSAEIDLALEVVGGPTRRIRRIVDGDTVIVIDGETETRWRLFQTDADITDLTAIDDATHIQARDQVPIAWAVPLAAREQAGRFWAFFPTETQTMTSGILNAPWKLNSDRTNLIRGPWNDALMMAASQLIAAKISALSTPDDPAAPISALPRQLDRQDDLAATLVNNLWELLVTREIVPNALGSLRRPADLLRHTIVEPDALTGWCALADETTRSSYVHPACYVGNNRAARLNTLANEADKRGGPDAKRALVQVALQNWLEPLFREETSQSSRALKFVASQVGPERPIQLSHLQSSKIVLSFIGRLVPLSSAVIAPAGHAPAGYHAVHPDIVGDPECKSVLKDILGVHEVDETIWNDVLKKTWNSAQNRENEEAWRTFWDSFSDAPLESAKRFAEDHDVWQRAAFRNLAGGWSRREGLIVLRGEESGDVAPRLTLDIAYHERHRSRLPDKVFDRFPPFSSVSFPKPKEATGRLLSPYLAEIERVGWQAMPPGPQRGKLGFINRDSLGLPGGWSLLPQLPRRMQAELTAILIKRLVLTPIIYGHLTRPDTYGDFSAPNPAVLLLRDHGRLVIGNATFPLQIIDRPLAQHLKEVGVAGLDVVSQYFTVRDSPTKLGGRINWRPIAASPTELTELWTKIFGCVSTVTTNFAALFPLWELAASEGFVPDTVPTSSGSRPVSEIFVTTDKRRIALSDADGTVIHLSEAALERWSAEGAQLLEDSATTQFSAQLASPVPVLDAFPELLAALDQSDELRGIDIAWVVGLTSKAGYLTEHPMIARASDRLILIERSKFDPLKWTDRIQSLVCALHQFGFISGEVDGRLARLLNQRVTDARVRVRNADTLAARLLQAVGESAVALRDILPEATQRALPSAIDPLELAALSLAVVGPTILGELGAVLSKEGLEPPSRWGTEAARLFVMELGFPLEYASSPAARREPELTVSGPLKLPPLHDYQKDILDDVGRLFASSNGRRRAVVSLPTGGGKTRVAAECVVKLVLTVGDNRTALWVAQTDELCEQAVQCFRQLWVNIGTSDVDLRIVRLWGGQKNPVSPESSDDAVVVIASIQTLNARSDASRLGWLAKPGIVVIDECHHAIAPSYSALLRWLDLQSGGQTAREIEPLVLGLSATPWRGHDDDESARLAARFDSRWFPADQRSLHTKLKARGILASLRYTPIEYNKPVTMTESDRRYFDLYGELPDSLVEKIGADPDRNDLIIDAVFANPAESILLFANSVDHAQYLAARLLLRGCSAAAVSGETDRLARQHFIRRFRSGDMRVMCNYSVLTTGFDAPRADMILISRPVFSPVRYMQMVGRGLRGPANGGTETCQIVTVQDNIVSYQDRLAYHYCQRFFEGVD